MILYTDEFVIRTNYNAGMKATLSNCDDINRSSLSILHCELYALFLLALYKQSIMPKFIAVYCKKSDSKQSSAARATGFQLWPFFPLQVYSRMLLFAPQMFAVSDMTLWACPQRSYLVLFTSRHVKG